MNTGRPTKYNEEILNKANDYLENHLDYEDIVPSIEGLSYFLGIAKSTIYKWSEEYNEFSVTLEAIKSKQAKLLINGGLGGDYNSTIVKLMLFNHGYTDKQSIEHSGGTDDKIEITVEYV